MRILLFGAGGHIGTGVTTELLDRGHEVTGVTRSGHLNHPAHPRLTAASGDAADAETVATLAAGHDAIVSTVGPKVGQENDREIIVGATTGLIEGARKAQVTRVVALGGAGSLRTPDGSLLVDSPSFPAMWKANAQAQAEALALYRTVDDLDWTFVSPAAQIEPGERTAEFRIGDDDLLVDGEGHSRVSIADYAVAFADEIESGAHPRRRICVAY
jgi:putative NADH-flavin reductase